MTFHMFSTIVIWLTIILFICFTFVVFFGAPFLPTLKKQIKPALDLIDLKEGQMMLELGCGDGRVMLEAAKRGIHSVGFELNPALVVIAKIRLWKYRHIARVKLGNFWMVKWPEADGIFTFLLTPYMDKLNKKITQDIKRPVKLVSFAFQIEGKKPSKTHNGLYLYTYNKKQIK